MAVPVRRATDKDATWQRGWTAATFADLAEIPDETWIIGPRRGDVAYVTDEATYYTWRDDGTWSAGGSGSSWIPLVDGSEPPVFITDGAGHLILVAYP